MHRLVGRALVGALAGLVTTALAAVFLAPAGVASPIGDAEAAMMDAWEKAGGDTSPLGARKGDVYTVGDGFALEFDDGTMFYTPATGAKYAYGPILEKYQSLGGPAGSDLGFPTINEVPGLAGPDSRVSTFAASDKPVIFWTADHGAFVVRGAMNAAWDKLGSSAGVLGVPVTDETYDGEFASQKFSGGQVSWNRETKEFTTEPAALADQLKGLQVPIDPTAAINMAWRAAGGVNGQLGAKQGGQYSVGGDGIAQNFAGGKVYFSPATGANAVDSDILAKYESLGGPAGSDLGFPVANESDGGIPSSRICIFAAAGKPVIFWTADHGAFVVSGAMKAAWDKLRGAGGKLGAPVGDQAVDGDVVSQKFAGGTISWNRAKNVFTTDPSNLAPLLGGLQIAGHNQPSAVAMPPHTKTPVWQQWWWILGGAAALVLVAALALGGAHVRRVRAGRDTAVGGAEPDAGVGNSHAADGIWGHDGDLQAFEEHPADAEPAHRFSWGRGTDVALAGEDIAPRRGYGDEAQSRPGQGGDGFESTFGVEEENPDTVDTDSIPVVTDASVSEAGYPDIEEELEEEEGYLDELESGYAELAPEDIPQHDGGMYGEYLELAPEGEYSDASGANDAGHSRAASGTVAPDFSGAAVPDEAVAAGEARSGRHAAVDTERTSPLAAHAASVGPSVAGRPTIHLPLDDPYQMPDGYPIKASARFGLYYTPGSALYQDTLAEIWLSSEQVAQANGFIKAD
ncbi:LGFP repeat-containing protein [Mycobacterium sp. THU-M116]